MNGIAKHDLLDKVVTLHKGIQIYKAAKSGTVRPKPYQYRDRIDVSVKLAFGLNEEGWKNLGLTQKEVEGLDIVKSISNNADLNQTIIDKGLVSRVKQASNVKAVKTFFKIEQKIYKNLNNIAWDNEEISGPLKKEYIKILSSHEPSLALEGLLKFNQHCIQIQSNQMLNDQQELIGLVRKQKGQIYYDVR